MKNSILLIVLILSTTSLAQTTPKEGGGVITGDAFPKENQKHEVLKELPNQKEIFSEFNPATYSISSIYFELSSGAMKP